MNNNENDFNRSNSKFQKAVLGADSLKEDNDLDELQNRIKENLGKINQFAINNNSSDIVDFINKVAYNANSKNGKGKNKGGRFGSFESEIETGEVNLFYGDETSRFMRYRSISSICQMIPELGRALIMYTDMISSPNSFNGNTLIFDIKKDGSSEFELVAAQKILDNLDKKYKFSSEISRICLGDLVKYGDSFTVVMNFKDEIEKLISESERFANEDALSYATAKEEDFISTDDTHKLNTVFKEIANESYKDNPKVLKSVLDKTYDSKEWTDDIDNFLNLNAVGAGAAVGGLFADEVEIYKEYKNNSNFASESADSDLNFGGSIIRQLEPEKVIKIEIGGQCIGYYYLDVVFNPTPRDPLGANPYNNPAYDMTNTTNRVYSFMNHTTNLTNNRDSRIEILSDIFSRRIAKKLDRNFIAKNSQFKDFIYNMLKSRRSINKTTITFIPPKNVIHMKKGSYTYGESILDPALYFAKLYVLSIMAAIMQQVISGKDKTVYYVETGLDEDSEGAVNKFISDLKSREISVDDFQDITAVFNRVTKPNALYIPVVDGKRAVEIDVFSGQDAQLNNDFLEFLKKSVVNGSGIPAALLDSMSDVEFATTLVMQNGNVLKAISTYQTIVTEGFTNIFKKLLENENNSGGYSSANDDKKENANFSFKVSYPSPTILDNRKTEEEMSRTSSIIDFLVSFLVNEQSEDENIEDTKMELRKLLVQKLMPQLDWESFEILLKESVQKAKEKKLADNVNKKAESDEDSEEGSDSPF